MLIPKRKCSRLFSLEFHYQQFFCSSEVTKLAIPGLEFSRNIEEIQCGISRAKQEITKIFRSTKEKITKNFAFIPNRCHIILQDFLQINSFVLSRISKGEITNLEIPVGFFQNICFPSFF